MFSLFKNNNTIVESDKITFLILRSDLRYKYSFDTLYTNEKFTKQEVDKLFFSVVKILYEKFVLTHKVYKGSDLEEFEILVSSIPTFENEVVLKLKKDLRKFSRKIYSFIEEEAPNHSAYKILFGSHMDFTP